MIERYRGPKRIRLHGERFAALREHMRHTLDDVARACGVSRQAVHWWEHEKTVPDDGSIVRLEALYGAENLVGVLDVKIYD